MSYQWEGQYATVQYILNRLLADKISHGEGGPTSMRKGCRAHIQKSRRPGWCSYSLYTAYSTVCKGGGGYGVMGFRQIKTCRKVPLQVHFFRWRHFALPSISLICLQCTWTKENCLLVCILQNMAPKRRNPGLQQKYPLHYICTVYNAITCVVCGRLQCLFCHLYILYMSPQAMYMI
jgi:hypothetical protein